MSALLETRGVGKAYGPFRALTGVSLSIAAGERLSIVGPNGAGKTTLVNLLTGLLVPSEGFVEKRLHWTIPSRWTVTVRASG